MSREDHMVRDSYKKSRLNSCKESTEKVKEEILIAPCGLDCGLCPVYVSTINNVKLEGNSEVLGVLGEDKCPSCRVKNKESSYCENYKCCVVKQGLKFCYECKYYPCKLLPSSSENSSSIKRWLSYIQHNSSP